MIDKVLIFYKNVKWALSHSWARVIPRVTIFFFSFTLSFYFNFRGTFINSPHFLVYCSEVRTNKCVGQELGQYLIKKELGKIQFPRALHAPTIALHVKLYMLHNKVYVHPHDLAQPWNIKYLTRNLTKTGSKAINANDQIMYCF